MKLPSLLAVGPAALTEALAIGYRRWGGTVETTCQPPDALRAERVLWLASAQPPELAAIHPSARLVDHCAAQPPAALPLWLEDSLAEQIWLPIALTARGALYAEAIAQAGGRYWLPEPLNDLQRQGLYHFARGLCDAPPGLPPGVYLVRFERRGARLHFAQLLPFPTAAALITLESQRPDLFECHWRCVLGLPLVDLQVHRPTAAAFIAEWPADLLRRAACGVEVRPYRFARMIQVQGPSLAEAHSVLGRLIESAG